MGARHPLPYAFAKAHNLLRMAAIGLPVPPALVIGTHFTHSPEDCMLPLFSVGLPALESATDMLFGDPRRPLIVSVRSGAPVSMPGMMETLLNIGLCDATVPGLIRQTGNPRLVWDAYRRLVSTYGEVVHGLSAEPFERATATLAVGRDDHVLGDGRRRAAVREVVHHQQGVGGDHGVGKRGLAGDEEPVAGVARKLLEHLARLRHGEHSVVVQPRLPVQRQHAGQIGLGGFADQKAHAPAPAAGWRDWQ